MAQYPNFPDRDQFPHLKDKVIVVAGGASGIGAALVTIAYHHGAHVVLGDINGDTGEALVQTLQSETQPQQGAIGLTFLQGDVCSYSDLYGLFRAAYEKHGRVDHAVFCAGIVDSAKSSYFEPNSTIDTIRWESGDTRPLDVNFLAPCAFARIALPFLRRCEGIESGNSDLTTTQSDRRSSDASLTFLSSVTGFRDAPPMFLYQTSKQAVLGLMRAMRGAIFARDGIRVNAVCPGMTDSPLTTASGLIALFKNRSAESQRALPSHYQSSMAVAEHIATVMLSKELNGKSIYVEEGKGWDFEDGLEREMPRWLGEEPTRFSNENLAFFSSFSG